MRSWLYSPGVALIGLVASIIALGQFIISLVRWVYRLTQAPDIKYRRARICAALVSLAVVVAFSFVSWSAIMAEAAKIGNGGVIGALYPYTMDGLALAGAAVLLHDAWTGRRFSVRPCCALISGLAVAATVYILHNGAVGWSVWVAAAAPGIVLTVTVPLMLSYAIRTRSSARAGS